MITHILKDGTVLKDITGHKVTKEDAPTVYEILERLRKQRRESNDIPRSAESKRNNQDHNHRE